MSEHSAARWLEIFVPGRICLMGEHSDWAGGYRRFNRAIVPGMCLVSGTNQGIYARVRSHPTGLVLSTVDHKGNKHGPEEFSMDPESLLRGAQEGGYFAYILGVAYQISVRYHTQGLYIENYKTDLPVQKGLSSSAAVTVLAARAFNRVYDLKLTVRGEMDLAYQGEITTPSQCGRMDQCCAFGARPVLMKFDGDLLECEELSLVAPLYIVIVELKGSKDTVEILQRLNKCYPVADDAQQAKLQEFLGPTNKRITLAAIDALSAGDVEKLGKLMEEFQRFFDEAAIPVCPSQLTAPNLHRILASEALRPHIWGCKGIGSQGDGCAQFLCKSAKDQEAVMTIVKREFDMVCLPLQIGATQSVTQALIPAATFSQLLFPASKSLPPALFPVLDSDGILKPAILLLVEEALEAGLSNVVIIVSPTHKREFQEIFHNQLDIRDFNKLPPRLMQYAKKIHETGAKVTLVVQEEQLGLGDAVLTAKQALRPEPFLLMLGDHLYRSTHKQGTSCVQQLLTAYQGTSMMALRRTAESDISHFGCVAGKWEARHGSLRYEQLCVTKVVEKPTVEYARTNLLTPGLASGEYLTAFGLYILTEPKLMQIIEEHKSHLPLNAGPLHLTPAIDQLRQEYGLLGFLLQGERYDIGGEPITYLETLNALARQPGTDGVCNGSPEKRQRV